MGILNQDEIQRFATRLVLGDQRALTAKANFDAKIREVAASLDIDHCDAVMADVMQEIRACLE